MNIRLAKINEMDLLNNLIALSARELSRTEYSPQEIDGAIRYVFGVDSELLEDKTYFVIEQNGVIAGCGGWSKRHTLFGGNQFSERKQATYLDPKTAAAKIRAFFIQPQFSRQGLGNLLLQHCEGEAVAHGFKKLEMMATLPGVKFYKAAGYQEIAQKNLVLPNQVELRFVHMEKIV